MSYSTIQASGTDAVRLLNEYRARYPETGRYPFLIGDQQDLELLQGVDECSEDSFSKILDAALQVNVGDWFAACWKQAERFQFSEPELLGEWPVGIADKGSIGLHKDALTGRIKSQVYLGVAEIEQPWQLPAVIPYGNWNACPEPVIHCALHRHWLEKYGAEITGVSGDVIECMVKAPPADKESAIDLAWQHYWYCNDIVEQGSGSISDLAATLLDSPYWYFWWD
jgi:hypothetical protein